MPTILAILGAVSQLKNMFGGNNQMSSSPQYIVPGKYSGMYNLPDLGVRRNQ